MSKITKLLMLPLLLSLLVGFSACGGNQLIEGSAVAFVPQDASTVTVVKLGQLLEKVDYESFKQTTFFKELVKNTDDDTAIFSSFLEDPAATGIDTKGEIVTFVTKIKEDEKLFTGVLIAIADKAKIKKTLEELSKTADKKIVIENRDGYDFITLTEEAFLIINDNVLAIISSDNKEIIASMLNPSAGIGNNNSFMKYYQSETDVFSWVKTDDLIEVIFEANPSWAFGLNFAQISSDDLKGNALISSYNFTDGEFLSSIILDMNPSLEEKIGALLKQKVTSDYHKYFPTESMVMAATLSLDIDEILAFMAARTWDKMADKQMGLTMNISLEDIQKTLVGDVAMAVYATEKSAVLTAIGIKDKAAAEAMLSKMNLVKEGDIWTGDIDRMNVYLKLLDEVVLVGTDKEVLTKYTSSTNNENIVLLEETKLGLLIDFEALSSGSKNFENNTLRQALAPIGKFTNLSRLTLLQKGNKLDTKIEFKNKNENPLKSILKFSEEMAKEKEEIDSEFDDFENFEVM